ncbi:MAG: cytochrome c biogenesis heme-transporting ATPase CcmA [Burkholderiales bacterium]
MIGRRIPAPSALLETAAIATDALLRAEGLECVRGERRLFGGIGFALASGTLLEVRGPNGSGKTSLLRMVGGLLPPAAGTITWKGRPIAELADEFRAELAHVGHLDAVKPELDALENLRLAARVAGFDAAPEGAASALREFGLAGFERLPCKSLSQGQRRRVALARLKLAGARTLWLLDEPFASLDAAGTARVRAVLEEHLRAGGAALLSTHHELEVAAPAAQRIELGP